MSWTLEHGAVASDVAVALRQLISSLALLSVAFSDSLPDIQQPKNSGVTRVRITQDSGWWVLAKSTRALVPTPPGAWNLSKGS